MLSRLSSVVLTFALLGVPAAAQVPPASLQVVGSGCGLIEVPQLSADLPVFGNLISLTVGGIPLAGGLFVASAGPPVQSALIGGCLAWVDLSTMVILGTFSTGHAGLAWGQVWIPFDPQLVGIEVTMQAAGFTPSYPVGSQLSTTNALHAVIGY